VSRPRRSLLDHVRWSEVDWPVLFLALVVLAVGLTFLRAMDLAEVIKEAGGVDFAGHRKKVLVTLPLVFGGMLLRPGFLRRHAGTFYALSLFLLAAVWVVGVERNNARRWIPLPMFDLQPSEIAKLGTILVLARILAGNRLEEARDWMLPIVVVLVPMAMVMTQPDLGTALTLVPIAGGMLYLAGARAGQLAGLAAAGLLLGYGAWSAGFAQEYQLQRVETWAGSFEPDDLIASKNGPGFHIYQARVVIGNGGLGGRGLGRGVANEARHLPERDCDSAFAVIAEESGFVGATGLILVYLLLVILLMLRAAALRDRFSRLVVGGVALYFAAHLFINVSVNLGLLPMTGLPLPLISAGGSSLLMSFLALGLALGLGSQHERALDRDAFRSY
jgi:rod shape determining protein RodA